MITNHALLGLILLSIEIAVLWVSSRPRFQKYFSFLPPVFWIYFVPMLFSSAGWIDPGSEFYPAVTRYLLPGSLVVLLMSTHIPLIIRLGRTALLMMAAGTLGIMLATPAVFGVFAQWVGPEMWSGFGALSGSWVGGSANMIAVKEAVGTPEHVFAPMVIVDTIVPYVWMGILIAGSGFQATFDRWNHSRKDILNELSRLSLSPEATRGIKFSCGATLGILGIAIVGAFTARGLGGMFPVIKDVLTTHVWTIVIATFLGLGLSLTPARELEKRGSAKIGYFLLYFVLTTIGARAKIVDPGAVGVLIAAGFAIVLIHGLFLIVAARILKAPMVLAAVASQANIGGVASAPIVAEVYHRGLASVGLLMGVLGSIIGTYSGIMTAQLCRMIARI